jgi:hypothetical protein
MLVMIEAFFLFAVCLKFCAPPKQVQTRTGDRSQPHRDRASPSFAPPTRAPEDSRPIGRASTV